MKPVVMEELEFEFEEETYRLSHEDAKKFRAEVEKQKIERAIEMFAMSCGDICDNYNDAELDAIELEITEE
jgi:hypothetical protein